MYLDVLITIFRMQAQFEFAMGDLSGRFRGLPEAPLEQILQKFCKISVCDKNNMYQKRTQSMQLASSDSTTQFKFMKNKESVKTLILHIIGLVIHLSTNGVAWGSFIAKILKKDQKELQNYFRELGVHTGEKKRDDKRTGETIQDMLVAFKHISIGNDKNDQVKE